MKSWEVIVTLKNGHVAEYGFVGTENHARQDAYLSFPQGEISSVRVTEEEQYDTL